MVIKVPIDYVCLIPNSDQAFPLPFLVFLLEQFLYHFLNIFILTAGSFDEVIPLPFPEYVLYTAGTRVVIKALIDYFGLITYSDQAFPLPFPEYFLYTAGTREWLLGFLLIT